MEWFTVNERGGKARARKEEEGEGIKRRVGLSTQRRLPGGGGACPELQFRPKGGMDSDDHPAGVRKVWGEIQKGTFLRKRSFTWQRHWEIKEI